MRFLIRFVFSRLLLVLSKLSSIGPDPSLYEVHDNHPRQSLGPSATWTLDYDKDVRHQA
jgi:hypothetical protein